MISNLLSVFLMYVALAQPNEGSSSDAGVQCMELKKSNFDSRINSGVDHYLSKDSSSSVIRDDSLSQCVTGANSTYYFFNDAKEVYFNNGKRYFHCLIPERTDVARYAGVKYLFCEN